LENRIAIALAENLVRQIRTAYFPGAAQHKSMGNGVFQFPYISNFIKKYGHPSQVLYTF